jgi:hypothetical protein
LLEFCGFLPQAAEGQDKEELEALEEEAEVRLITVCRNITLGSGHVGLVPVCQSRRCSHVSFHFLCSFAG